MPAKRIAEFAGALSSTSPWLLDGAVGTELARRGVDTALPLWSATALLTAPDVVRAIHRDYAAAGADILVANTFRTNPRTLRGAGRLADGPSLCKLAVQLARQAAADAGGVPLVAASIAPVEDCYRPDLVPADADLTREHRQLVAWLADAAPDLLWIETMNTQREALAAAQAARASGLPFVVSFVVDERGSLLSGEPLEPAVAAVANAGARAIGLNCIPPQGMTVCLPRLRAATTLPLVAYAHIGNPCPIRGWSFSQDVPPTAYAMQAVRWIEQGAAVVGGCCGTTPAHIAALRRRIDVERN